MNQQDRVKVNKVVAGIDRELGAIKQDLDKNIVYARLEDVKELLEKIKADIDEL